MGRDIKIDAESVKQAIQSNSGRPKILIIGADNAGVLKDLIEGEDFIVDYANGRVDIKESWATVLAKFTAGDVCAIDRPEFNGTKRKMSEVKQHKHPNRRFR